MTQAEYRFGKSEKLAGAMKCYETALRMPDDAPFTVPSWFIRDMSQEYLSTKNLSGLTQKDPNYKFP
jgi:hypothetical protein